jgi:hypothetical protein
MLHASLDMPTYDSIAAGKSARVKRIPVVWLLAPWHLYNSVGVKINANFRHSKYLTGRPAVTELF